MNFKHPIALVVILVGVATTTVNAGFLHAAPIIAIPPPTLISRPIIAAPLPIISTTIARPLVATPIISRPIIAAPLPIISAPIARPLLTAPALSGSPIW